MGMAIVTNTKDNVLAQKSFIHLYIMECFGYTDEWAYTTPGYNTEDFWGNFQGELLQACSVFCCQYVIIHQMKAC